MPSRGWESASASYARMQAFLRSHHADEQDHSGETLLAHLCGTHELLTAWGCPDDLCRAGLFHSVYGTEVFRPVTVPLAGRARVRGLIGPEAETIVYLYSVVSRDSLYEQAGHRGARTLRAAGPHGAFGVSEERFAELLTLDLANSLEQLPRLGPGEPATRLKRDAYRKAAALLSERGVAAMRAAYG
jgi:hypothetical protein